jgi:ParB-like chromosome segregation protein Spo0J
LTQTITLALVRADRDPCFWPRERLAMGRVKEFEEIYRHDGPEAVDPIVVAPPGADGLCLVIDGWHRIEAAQRAGLGCLQAVVRPVASDEEAYELAVSLSSRGPRPMSRAEKRAAVDRLLENNPRRADHAIAQIAGVSNHFVAKRRRLRGQPAKERAVAESAGLERHVAALLRAAQKIDEARRSAGWEADGVVARCEIEAALAAAAQKRHGAEAELCLRRLERWARGAQSQPTAGEDREEVMREAPLRAAG